MLTIGISISATPIRTEHQVRQLTILEELQVREQASYLNDMAYGVIKFKTKEELIELAKQQRIKELEHSEFTFDNFVEYLDLIGIKNRDIIVKKAIIESGWFKSSLMTKYNNIFGMNLPQVRETTANGIAFKKTVFYKASEGRLGERTITYKYAKYKHWTASVSDLVMWTNYWENKGYDTSDYYKFLNDVGYGYESNYIKVLKSVNVKKYYPQYA